MVAVAGDRLPETTPLAYPAGVIEAIVPGLLLHVPPDVISLRVVPAPWHKAKEPAMAAGMGFIVMVLRAAVMPQTPALV